MKYPPKHHEAHTPALLANDHIFILLLVFLTSFVSFNLGTDFDPYIHTIVMVTNIGLIIIHYWIQQLNMVCVQYILLDTC